ncbi:hypothetical protein BGZ74_000359 [Mortierella antarctica]|nr:hypothetical protein BGZ74_000359 [Mortierella antarctica]
MHASSIPCGKSIMKAILYLVAALTIVGIAVAAPVETNTQDSCWCEPDFRGQKPRKSPSCCY